MLALMTSLALTVATPLPDDVLEAKPLVRRNAENQWVLPLSIDAEGRLRLGDRQVTQEALSRRLEAELRRFRKERPNDQVQLEITAHPSTKADRLVRVMEVGDKAGFAGCVFRLR